MLWFSYDYHNCLNSKWEEEISDHQMEIYLIGAWTKWLFCRLYFKGIHVSLNCFYLGDKLLALVHVLASSAKPLLEPVMIWLLFVSQGLSLFMDGDLTLWPCDTIWRRSSKLRNHFVWASMCWLNLKNDINHNSFKWVRWYFVGRKPYLLHALLYLIKLSPNTVWVIFIYSISNPMVLWALIM